MGLNILWYFVYDWTYKKSYWYLVLYWKWPQQKSQNNYWKVSLKLLSFWMSPGSRMALALIARNMTLVTSRSFPWIVNGPQIHVPKDAPICRAWWNAWIKKSLGWMCLCHTKCMHADGITPYCPIGLSSTEAKMLWLLNDMACVALLSQASLDKDLFIGGSFSWESPAPGQVTPFKIRLDRVINLNWLDFRQSPSPLAAPEISRFASSDWSRIKSPTLWK